MYRQNQPNAVSDNWLNDVLRYPHWWTDSGSRYHVNIQSVFRWFLSYKCCNPVFKSVVTYSKHTAFARHPAFSHFLQLSSGFTLTKLEVRSLRVFSGFLLTNDEMPSLGITHLFIFPVVSHFCWSAFIRNLLRLHAYRCWSPTSGCCEWTSSIYSIWKLRRVFSWLSIRVASVP